VTLSDLAKYSVTRSVARSLCDSWASCYSNLANKQLHTRDHKIYLDAIMHDKGKKVKERIVLSEIHLRTTGHHLSMRSHSVICHPTDVTAPPIIKQYAKIGKSQ